MAIKNKKKTYLTPNEAAALLMVSPITVRQWAQKGDLSAMSTPGGHRRFLRRDVERFAKERGIALLENDMDIPRILVVDDDRQLAKYLVTLLSRFPGVETDVAYDGFEAGLKIKDFKPQSVLLDIMMPNMNGIEVCKLLRDEPSTKNIRIIAMTGFHSDENVDKILDAGANVCLSKPIDTHQLFNALELDEGTMVKQAGL